jgi:undecaprenyl diphosphate synthase
LTGGGGGIRPEAIPRHIAVIMDGNGRWAEERGLPRTDGHRAGVDAVRRIVRAARDIGVPWLTLFAFSTENWQRPKDEVDLLMKLPEEFFATELPDAIQNGVRIQMIGNRARLPAHVVATLDEAIGATRGNGTMHLTFALSYGGRGEIVEAVRRLLRDRDLGQLDPDSLDEKRFAQYLDDPELPDVDLLIRTGSERRISNFLLWQLAYAEIHVSDAMWPDFDREDLEAAILDYQSRERRYGRTSAQVRGEGGSAR